MDLVSILVYTTSNISWPEATDHASRSSMKVTGISICNASAIAEQAQEI